MENKPTHTPGPWAVHRPGTYGIDVISTSVGNLVAECNPELGRNERDQETAMANAAYIVRAVNAHEELVEALSGLRDNLRDLAVCNGSVEELAHRLADLADKAIAKAEGH